MIKKIKQNLLTREENNEGTWFDQYFFIDRKNNNNNEGLQFSTSEKNMAKHLSASHVILNCTDVGLAQVD